MVILTLEFSLLVQHLYCFYTEATVYISTSTNAHVLNTRKTLGTTRKPLVLHKLQITKKVDTKMVSP